ncbi:MAG: plasmid pRiA4b ORF-3 family protein [Acidobacteria bacterium]|jgi:hypothetical protein|nr:plasmid pRiA4b ORF-3 family protein [Acidobacteriota bacterium]
MPDTWVTNLSHFLQDDGSLAGGPPGRLGAFFAGIVEAATTGRFGAPRVLPVACRRRPGRRPCPGPIVAAAAGETVGDGGEGITWECRGCGDRGLVSGWAGTAWDRREGRTPRPAAPRTGPASGADEILQLRVQLDRVRPAVWRRIQLPATCTFWDLHVAIQDAMGWTDSHLHVFEAEGPGGTVRRIGIPDGLAGLSGETEPAWDVSVASVLSRRRPELTYWYDFGDDWFHTVRLEKGLPREPGARYPRCLAGARACPPEDCGGPIGYGELLAVLRDRYHPEHGELTDWLGGAFDPAAFDPAQVAFRDPRARLAEVLRPLRPRGGGGGGRGRRA